MKRKLICLAVPMMLFVGGCGNEEVKKEDKVEAVEKEKLAYIDQVLQFSNDFEDIVGKVSKLTHEDETLFSNKEEFIEVVKEFTELFDRLNTLEPDEEYKVQHDKLKRAMGYYSIAFSLQLESIDDPYSGKIKEATSNLKDGLALYMKSMGAINDIRRGYEIGTTEKNLEEKKQNKEG